MNTVVKRASRNALVIPTWQTSVSLLVFEEQCLGECLHHRKEVDFECFRPQPKKKEQFLRELFEVELFPTSCPHIFLALSAAPRDLAPAEMNGSFPHCMG